MKSLIKKMRHKMTNNNSDNSAHIQDVDAQPKLSKANCERSEIEYDDFKTQFLKASKIEDRRQVYISGDFYDKISTYLRIISDEKISIVGYISNVLEHHMLENKDLINKLYQNKLNKSNPL
jgi:hypothetical protein